MRRGALRSSICCYLTLQPISAIAVFECPRWLSEFDSPPYLGCSVGDQGWLNLGASPFDPALASPNAAEKHWWGKAAQRLLKSIRSVQRELARWLVQRDSDI